MPKKSKKTKSKNLKKNYKNHFLTVGISFTIFLALTNLFVFSKKTSINKKVLGVNVIKTYSPTLTQEAQYWESLISKNPTYRDAYLELSDIYLKLGDLSKADSFYQTAKNLDPNNLSF